MKKQLLHIFYCTLLFIFPFQYGHAQVLSDIKGKVTTQANIPAVSYYILLLQNGEIKSQTQTNQLGNYNFSYIMEGNYALMVLGRLKDTLLTKSITVTSGTIVVQNLRVRISENMIGAIYVPRTTHTIVNPPNGGGRIIGQKDILKTGKTVANLVLQTNGFNSVNGRLSGIGNRSNGTRYFLDGMPVSNVNILSAQSIGGISSYLSGVPAELGDFTGGGVSISTRPIGLKKTRAFEMRTSQFINPSSFSNIDMYFSGPLLTRRTFKLNKEGEKTHKRKRSLLSYGMGMYIGYNQDLAPSYTPFYKLKSDVQQRLNENPLSLTKDGAIVHAGNFLTYDDMEKIKVRSNSSGIRGSMNLKLEYSPTRNSQITAFGSYLQSNNDNVKGQAQILMNSENTLALKNQNIYTYLRFFSRIKNPSKETQNKRTTIVNSAYRVKLTYEKVNNSGMDAKHKNNLFDYGYVGKFTKFPTPFFAYSNPDNDPTKTADEFITKDGKKIYARDYYRQIGFRDSAIYFQRAELNPIKANYTSNLYKLMAGQGNQIRSDLQIQQRNGLLNGYNPQNIYSLYFTPRFNNNQNFKNQQESFSIRAIFEGQIQGAMYNKLTNKYLERRKHSIQFGLNYEQKIERGYSVNANSLWRLMPQLANKHIAEMDLSNPILSFNENGVFQDTVRYNRLVNYNEQSHFDKSLRSKLINSGAKDVYGKDIDEQSFLDINSYEPDMYSLNMFSADELLNNGNSYVRYYGYDYLGNKTKGNTSVEAFVNDPKNRAVGSYTPTYGAVWLQDKFDFDGLIVRAGVRVERFDANQRVLKDPYSLYPIKTAGEVNIIDGKDINHPKNISADAKVYVNDMDAPTQILGYREGSNWFDSKGNKLANPEILAQQTSSGSIAPFLVDADNQQITSESFEDYTPDIHVLPRLMFNFPLRKNISWFYASYDVLAQRPSGNNVITMDDYYFMRSRATKTFANPNLKSRVKNNYEVGFKQRLGRKSILNLLVSYSEVKNDIQLRNYTQAYPISYMSYDNIDFSTIKSFRLGYDFYDGKYLSYTVNYSLLFADGTGSNVNAQRALIQAQLPNMRTLLPLGAYDIRHTIKGQFNYNFKGGKNSRTKKGRYKGPIWRIGKKDRKIFEYVNINLSTIVNSGLPYTPRDRASQLGTPSNSNIKGNPFNARMPWQFTLDGNITKTFRIKVGDKKDKEGKKTGKNKIAKLDVFLTVSNILNTKNIRNVFDYTGSANDDGFLNSPQGQQAISSQLDAQAFQDLYNISMQSRGAYTAPRRTSIGVRLRY